jgi:hypothetical protein
MPVAPTIATRNFAVDDTKTSWGGQLYHATCGLSQPIGISRGRGRVL